MNTNLLCTRRHKASPSDENTPSESATESARSADAQRELAERKKRERKAIQEDMAVFCRGRPVPSPNRPLHSS